MNKTQFLSWLYQQPKPASLNVWQKPLLMGVINVTQESFSDGGDFWAADKAVAHGLKLIEQGADLLDIGGEATNPGALPISAEQELERIIPVIEGLRAQSDICISVDTYKPEVMQHAVAAGANVINDIYALQMPGAEAMAAQLAVPVCLMHMQGQPNTMQENPVYPNGVVHEIKQFFGHRIDACIKAGIERRNLILDPGFGFGKLVSHNMRIMHQLKDFQEFNLPLLLGFSRKSTIGAILNKEVHQRLIGGIALSVLAAENGVGIIRTHDVDETGQALHMINAVYEEVE